MSTKLADQELLKELERRFNDNKRQLDELNQLTEELKVANKKLEESEALKSHFISNITNEIINPFTSIIGLAKNILSVEKESWKTVITMVSHIYTEAFNLDFQFRNIFVAAKLEAGEITPEICRVDIEKIIESLIDAFKVEAKKKNLKVDNQFTIKKEKPFYFKTDPEKFRLILANLLSNAIKYSNNNTTIIFKTWLEENLLKISVQDFGPGISEENQKIIFDRFRRIDSGINSINRGHGLGLSVNKALLDLFNGDISIDTKTGKGSTFTISIPEADEDSNVTASDDNELFFTDDSSCDEETF